MPDRHLPDALVLVAALAGSVSAGGVDRVWITDGGGSFHASGNWSPVGVPGTLDTAIFDLGVDLDITFGGVAASEQAVVVDKVTTFTLAGQTYTVNGVTVGDGDGDDAELIISGGALAVVPSLFARIGKQFGAIGELTIDAGGTLTATDSLIAGDAGAGTLTIENGGDATTARVFIADDLGSTGLVRVRDAGSTWTSQDAVFVGNAGDGTLAVSAAGVAECQQPVRLGDDFGSTGVVTVSGAGSALTVNAALSVGNGGTGTVTVDAGGTLTTSGSFVADDIGSSGSLVVEGAGATWTDTGTTFLGNFGDGDLEIRSGGSVTWESVSRIGDELGSTGSVLIDGAGSSLTVDAELFVGNNGVGTLTATNGGTLTTSRVKIADERGSTGTVDVIGPTASWTDSVEIFVGNFGLGTLNISAGGTVAGLLGTIGDDPGANGTVVVSGAGSSFDFTQQLTVADLGAGTLQLIDSATASALFITIGTQGVAAGHGTLQGSVTSGGILRPDGVLSIDGVFAQVAGGRIEVTLASTGGDAVAVTGAATLNGALDVAFDAGSEPTCGQEFLVLTAASVAGTFATVTAPENVEVTYEAGAVRLMITGDGGSVIGDVDGDGSVGFNDLLILLSAWGDCPAKGPCAADINGDGTVGFSDLLSLISNWGGTGGGCP
ncbi:MAG: hypothetical protein HKO59_12540 [Phycisphaerales bacterium]|nr:hypothetical protein [Phycisphaerales bacterium]NNM26790.1 hypothetical protein [Phycisphaerales bacterium]